MSSPDTPLPPEAILLSAWAPSTVSKYLQGVQLLLSIAQANPHLCTWDPFFAHAAAHLIQLGYSPSSVKNILSSAKFLFHLRLIPSFPGPSHWLYVKAATRLYHAPSTKLWGSPSWFANLAGACSTLEDKILYALLFLSFALGFRASEAANLPIQYLAQLPSQAHLQFHAVKSPSDQTLTARTLLPFPKRWALYLLLLL